jgi:hypothetical protein
MSRNAINGKISDTPKHRTNLSCTSELSMHDLAVFLQLSEFAEHSSDHTLKAHSVKES